MTENNLKNELKTAKTLMESKDFGRASILYKDIYSEAADLLNEWDLWSWSRALYKLKRYQETLDVCRIGFRGYPKFQPLHSVYAWSIYQTNISIKNIENEAVFLKAVHAILKMSSIEDPYGPSMKTLFIVSKYFVQKGMFREALEWIERIPPSDLSTDVFRFKDYTGKWVELASQKENYCAMKSKVLLKLNKHDACIEVCNFGLTSISKFHYNNNIWFKWRIVLSNISLKNWDVASELITEILQKKDDWFLKDAQAEILLGQGKDNEALIAMSEAALAYGDLDKKINLFKSMTFLLDKMGDVEKAKRHLELVFLILETNQWKISENISQLISKYEITDVKDKRKLLKELKVDWEIIFMSNQNFIKGQIKTILPNGKAGFIQSVRNSYYFHVSDIEGRKGLEGQKVKFLTKKGFDKKKNRATEVAYKISVE